ncbi:MAG: hypothetical protein E7Z98_01020 [Olsenella sp.]|nr:hypothetical protein [Olsenella sp.]
MLAWTADDFERLTKRFFCRDFANMTKTELEVYLFDIYMRGVEREGTRPSYYQIGRQLGLTEARVRTLSVRRSLAFQEQPSEEDCLLYLLEHAPSNLLEDKRIRIQVNDPIYLQAIQDIVESKNLGFEPELTGRALRISLADFFLLLDETFGSDVTGKAVQDICRQAKRNGAIAEDAMARSLEQIAMSPSTYVDLLKPLLLDRDLVTFGKRLATLINEAVTERAWSSKIEGVE